MIKAIFWLCIFFVLLYFLVIRVSLKGKELQKITDGAEYAGFAKIIGGNHPLLGSEAKNMILAIKGNELIVLGIDGTKLVSSLIKNVKAETITVSATTSANLFLFGLMSLGAKEQLLQLEIYDENTKETYKSLFKNTGFKPDWINKERYNYLTEENSSQAVQS